MAREPKATLHEFMTAPRSALQKRMDQIIPSLEARMMAGVPGDWVYFDMPGTVTYAQWDQFLQIVGIGHYIVLGQTKTEDWTRAQFFISPAGMERLEAFKRGNLQ